MKKNQTQNFQRTPQTSDSTEATPLSPEAYVQTRISKQHCSGAHRSETGQTHPNDKGESIWKAWQLSQPTVSGSSTQIHLKIQV